METIVNNLKDPSWWFSAFFVAIIASVFAGFLKDNIEKCLSGVFSGIKSWRSKRQEEQSNLIQALINDQMYFQIVLFRAAIILILFALSLIIFFSAPILLFTIDEWPESHLLLINKKNVFLSLFTLFMGLFSIVIGFRASSYIHFVSQAIQEYRKHNNLPKMF